MAARYDTTSRYTLEDNNQTATRKKIAKASFTLYRIRAGDSLETLSAQLLGDVHRWWEIADLNPQFKFPTDIVVGEYLRIPR